KRPNDADAVIFEKAKAFHAERLNNERRAREEEQKRNIVAHKQRMLAGRERANREEKYVPIKVNTGRDH
ncbi:MAG: hypothetical protein J6W96_03330, partial [Alphaproteobacteria bacterium]|nr:hypothetical protein [Alphaproteobacteria bacterium]